ncbi:malto-oligosyltrehalose trehalohydrolase [Silvibacterium dinghuense]|uniref:Malto-oligosyltrehalose trehalohydrolase n=1 Tax=Silvibacterium dinghuense TaxID=1560006 RepID=A0A4Q1SIH0_9BACT|nr:malto-oligosyltrehalose trehalohydrolase [Silvibacterium dinghuense]RXS97193.1 malto-oligosyltrehalose trehalohydrolase [Silvibacterium dinghuense]GGG96970.1 malto-oligosyltrehalose trehalohydrolase [Silvibacterium dinghuense]
MHTFRIWAPAVTSVSVLIDGTATPLTPQNGGWWQADIASAGPGTGYQFLLDSDDYAVPDPRSLWQPEGVHGPSRIYDHAAFQWTDQSWKPSAWPEAIVYELHIGTFTEAGTLDAAIERLPYLKSLGITHVELLPVASFPGAHGWGYDGVDLFAPQESYGGPDALKRFVDACHAHGMATILDVVYNHFGPSGNYVGRFGPYFTASHHTPWGDAVNLEEGGSHEVRRFFTDNALMWLRDYHFDGLRLDAVHAFMDRSAIHFMEQLSIEVAALEAEKGREYVLIAESDLNDPRIIAPREENGYGFDAQWSDDFHHALIALLTGDRGGYYADFGSIAGLVKALRHAYVYDGQYSQYRDHHHGRPAAGLPGWRFLGYAQNHDQVGNRAQGERLSHLSGAGRAKIAAALVLTAPFVPMLFQGEEWAASTPFQYFTDHEDKELGRLVSDGRKKEFGAFGWNPEDVPDPQHHATFERSKLRWEELSDPVHAAMLDWYKKLIALRRATPELTDGRLDQVEVRFSEEQRWLTMRRGAIFVAVNLNTAPIGVEVSKSVMPLLASDPAIVISGPTITLPSDTIAIVKLV